MTFDEFVSETKTKFNGMLSNYENLKNSGQLNLEGKTMLFPTILLLTDCSDHYIAELVGAAEEFKPLKIKRHREQSIHRYFSQFYDFVSSSPSVDIRHSYISLRNLCFAANADIKAVRSRFPHVNYDYLPVMTSTAKGGGSLIDIHEDVDGIEFQNIFFVNKKANVYRCKSISLLYVCSKSANRETLSNLGSCKEGERIAGVHFTQGELSKRHVVVGQLQNMYLFPKLHETTIGAFLNSHPDIVHKALNCQEFVYEPHLNWIEHDGTCDDQAINPDLLVKRSDGYFDIYDLKTSAMEKKNLTRGKRKRRRFIDYVAEGIAQLANYREYFTYAKNADLAFKKYGIQVKSPKLVLIVGSWENTSSEEVEQACRTYTEVDIIDYDTFCHMYINAKF